MTPIIAITGPMGSGKTTLGRALAFRSGYMFFEERFEGSVSETWLDKFKEKNEQELQNLPEIKRFHLDSETYNLKDEQQINIIYEKIMKELQSENR